MPKAIWKGGISFGLVYIPVKLYSGASEHDLDLHMLRKGDQCPIKYTRVCEQDGKEVSVPEIEAQESAVQDLMEQLRKSLEMTG